MPPRVLVSLLVPGCSEEIATIFVGICGRVLLFDTWNLLQGHRLGIQCLSIYAILLVMMASLGFHATVASVAEFCVPRVAISNSGSLGHKFNEVGPSNC